MAVKIEQRVLWTYAATHCHSAVRILTLHPGALRHRLRACAPALTLIRAQTLPARQAALCADIIARLTRRTDATGQPSAEQTLRGLHRATLVRLAKDICQLAAEVEQLALVSPCAAVRTYPAKGTAAVAAVAVEGEQPQGMG